MTAGGEAAAPGTAAADRRALSFATEAEAAADVRHLRRGYRQVGRWTLPQMCRHLAGSIDRTLADPDPSAPPPVVDPSARVYMDHTLTTGQIPSGRPAPAISVPPADCGDGDVDALLAALDRMARFAKPEVLFGRFGVVPLADARRFHLVHLSHHLSHLIPIA
jgi:hypothetical protein